MTVYSGILRWTGAAACTVLAAMATPPLAVAAEAPSFDAVRVTQGFAIAPVPLNLNGLDRTLVGLGSYLVNAAGGCNDCHTNPSFIGNPFAGDRPRINAARYLAGGTEFGPGIVSSNLTPNAQRLPGGMTYAEFVAAMREGKDPNQAGRILQVMPWPILRNLIGRDMRAIYEYLRAIPRR
jgi:hypothetical protein